MKSFGWIVILIFIIIGGVILNAMLTLYYSYRNPKFDPTDDTALFWAESALQYHYAKQIAYGNSLPKIDTRAQYPEGLSLKYDLTILMEHIVGWIYRLTQGFGLPFHVYVVWWTSFFSALSVGALGLLIFMGTKNVWAVLWSVLFYALSPIAFARTAGNFLREDFALPFFFFGIAFLVIALRYTHYRLVFFIIAAIFFSILLRAWHFGQFAFLSVMIYLTLVYLFRPEKIGLVELGGFIGVVFLLSLFSPPLRSRFFLFSAPMVLGYTLLISAYAYRKTLMSAFRRHISSLVVFVILLSSFRMLTHRADYSHVFQLAINKFRFFLQKPADPALLPYHARILWLDPFGSPSLGEFLYQFGTVIFLSGATIIFLSRYWRKLSLTQFTLIYFSLLFLVATILVERMDVFAIFFLSGLIAYFYGGIFRIKYGRLITLSILIMSLGIQGWIVTHYDQPNIFRQWTQKLSPSRLEIPNYHSDTIEMIRWILEKTPTNAVFLTRFAVGPTIYVYGNRTINLQPKFETVRIREKVRQFNESLYQSEEQFYRLCRKWGVTHFVYEASFTLDNSKESIRYLADRLELPTNTFAYQCHFEEDSLKYFQRVYENFYFRIFEIIQKEDEDHQNFLQQPLFAENLFAIDSTATIFDDQHTDKVIHQIEQATEHNNRGIYFLQQGQNTKAIKEFELAIQMVPLLPKPYFNLIKIYMDTNNLSQVESTFTRLLIVHPDFAPFRLQFGLFWMQQEIWQRAIDEFQLAAKLNPRDPNVFYYLGTAYANNGDQDTAQKMWERAVIPITD